MTQQISTNTGDSLRAGAAGYDGPVVSGRGTGGALFAAVLMIIGGFFGMFQGIALLAKGSYYVQPANYWINTSATTWGWIMLIAGVVVLAAGFGVISGAA